MNKDLQKISITWNEAQVAATTDENDVRLSTTWGSRIKIQR